MAPGDPRTCWCARCRKTFEDLAQAAACPCGLGIPARRGEYVIRAAEFTGARRSLCSCGEALIFIPSPLGSGTVPVAVSRIRTVTCPTCPQAVNAGAPGPRDCPTCRNRRSILLGLAHFLDCPDAAKHRKKRPAKPENRPGGYASPHGNREPQAGGPGAPGDTGPPPPGRPALEREGLRAAAVDGAGDQPPPRPVRVRPSAQALLACLRQHPEPLTSSELEGLTRLPSPAVQRALAHLRARGLARPVPRDAEAGEARNAWETTPRGDREDVPQT